MLAAAVILVFEVPTEIKRLARPSISASFTKDPRLRVYVMDSQVPSAVDDRVDLLCSTVDSQLKEHRHGHQNFTSRSTPA